MTRDKRLDLALSARINAEPYFASEWLAARNLLRHATFGADLVRFPGGRVVRGPACRCQGSVRCLHAMGWLLYAGEKTA